MRSGSFFPYLDHFWPVLFLDIYSMVDWQVSANWLESCDS